MDCKMEMCGLEFNSTGLITFLQLETEAREYGGPLWGILPGYANY